MTTAPSPMVRYINVVDPINADYAELRAQLKRKDLRVFCLLDFEMTLSFMLDKSITEYDAWRKIREKINLDKMSPYTVLTYNTFRWVMSQYEQIMRDAKLIGAWEKNKASGTWSKYWSDEDVQQRTLLP